MRRGIVFTLLVFTSTACFGQELGRLFFTPEQRAALDARRKARMPDKPAAVVASPTTKLDGYVRRSTGPSTVWVNGEPLPEGAPEAPRGLRPGQVLDRGTGEVRDVIGEGEIRVHPGRP
jgi:hypothetical protein